jgi:hypothetical protein
MSVFENCLILFYYLPRSRLLVNVRQIVDAGALLMAICMCVCMYILYIYIYIYIYVYAFMHAYRTSWKLQVRHTSPFWRTPPRIPPNFRAPLAPHDICSNLTRRTPHRGCGQSEREMAGIYESRSRLYNALQSEMWVSLVNLHNATSYLLIESHTIDNHAENVNRQPHLNPKPVPRRTF